MPVSVGPTSSSRCHRFDDRRLQKLGNSCFGETEFRIGKSEFTRVWLMAEVVHLGGTELEESVCPRLLMSVLSSESC